MVQHLTLADGRTVDFVVEGAEDGFPFVWFHGTPGSYKATLPSLVAICKERGLKIISLSRPGYGGSSRHAGRCVVDEVADVQALIDHLSMKQCVVGGWSGGGPSVLACAARLPSCLGALCVAGVAPYGVDGLDWLAGQGQDNIDEFNAAQRGEADIRSYLDNVRPGLLSSDAAGVVEEMASILPEVDKNALLKNQDIGQGVVDGFHEGLKDGVDGWLDDDLELLKPWGFELSEIKVPVYLYQGSDDKMVPFAHGEWLAKHLPQNYVRGHLLEGEGHISIFLGQVENMVNELLEVAKP
ncbi:hypothetical protein LTR36_003777 [Oleoguttula mirabilis]|uniref:AB hydrolase-1 domain-containing protein n=1 Tax=Oleoguttula mirabilis TaxID=1507867 RepID=A0AAV9JJ02_9PEZI|nr:hypothetical protein LTR36_003777 [Oleoguttula mirabilis]